MKVDAWLQHPTLRLLSHEMFAPLLRWTSAEPPEEDPPLELTLASMDEGGIDVGLSSAWYGPDGVLISNDEVAKFVAQAPERLAGVASVDIRRPVAAVAELGGAWRSLGSKLFGSFLGCGGCPRTTAITTPCTWRVLNSASLLHAGRAYRSASQF
jgi:uncharacterized protein